jgi:uncharacterized membrane protein YeaQ/YmgE (transglycosylase-associated protein family)
MHIINLILLGLITGILAKSLLPGKDAGGLLIKILLGIAGSLVGGFVATTLGMTRGLTTFVLALIGAMALVLAYKIIKGITASA